MTARCLTPALLASTLLLVSCRKPAVEAYRVPKETAPQPVAAANASPHGNTPMTPPSGAPAAAPSAAPAMPAAGAGAMANTAVTTASGAALTWTAPAHWKPKAASSMRKGSYTVTSDGVAGEADLAITAFPGDVGGDLANLNRWRGQVQLGPIGEAELASSAQRLERNGLKIMLVDVAGNGQRILGASVPYQGATWFFKLSGPDALVAKEKAAFTAFVDTIKPATTTP